MLFKVVLSTFASRKVLYVDELTERFLLQEKEASINKLEIFGEIV
jgi:hypothetical protein